MMVTVDYTIGGNPVSVTGQRAEYRFCTCGTHDISKECLTVSRVDNGTFTGKAVCIPLTIVEKITEISVEGLTSP